jgi:hypothetical protein
MVVWHTEKTGRRFLYWIDKQGTPAKQGLLMSLDLEGVFRDLGASLSQEAITLIQNGMIDKGFVIAADYGKMGVTEALVPLLMSAGKMQKREAKSLASQFVRFLKIAKD